MKDVLFLKFDTDNEGYAKLGAEYIQGFYKNAVEAFPDKKIFAYFGFDIHTMDEGKFEKIEDLNELKEILNQKMELDKVDGLKIVEEK